MINPASCQRTHKIPLPSQASKSWQLTPQHLTISRPNPTPYYFCFPARNRLCGRNYLHNSARYIASSYGSMSSDGQTYVFDIEVCWYGQSRAGMCALFIIRRYNITPVITHAKLFVENLPRLESKQFSNVDVLELASRRPYSLDIISLT